jgi:phosphoribosyl 1,2-cyclic phosphodiesterase
LGRIQDTRNFEVGSGFFVGAMHIHPFSISHDAEDPAGFTIRQNGKKIGIATDLGIATAMVKEHMKECDVVILEANHDPAMLISGPYPWPLKQRVRERTGHLSNEASAGLLAEIKHDRLSHVVLAHLSETNNTPEKAVCAVGQAMNQSRARLTVAYQDVCGDIFRF